VKPRPDMTPTTNCLTLAGAYACELSVDDPADVLARRRVELRAFPDPLVLRRKLVWGAWHPSIRRIEVFGCSAARSDRRIVGCLAHEIWHMEHGGRLSAIDERHADRWARCVVRALSAGRLAHCARALRCMARPASAPCRMEDVHPNPVCIGP
jgi:hypothetical protein